MEFRLSGLEKLLRRTEKMKDLEPYREAISQSGAKAFRYTNQNTPVETRFLKRSEGMNIIDDGLTAELYYSAEYGPYVEYGTRFMYGRYFMKRGMQQVRPEFSAAMRRAQRKQMGGS